jgi:hypothetical protein
MEYMQKGGQKPRKDEKHCLKIWNIAIQEVICLMINVFIYSCSQWVRDSYSYYDALRRSEQAPRAGLSQLSGYIFSNVDQSIVQVGYIMIM